MQRAPPWEIIHTRQEPHDATKTLKHVWGTITKTHDSRTDMKMSHRLPIIVMHGITYLAGQCFVVFYGGLVRLDVNIVPHAVARHAQTLNI